MIVGRNKIVVAYGDVWIISSETQDVIVIKRLFAVQLVYLFTWTVGIVMGPVLVIMMPVQFVGKVYLFLINMFRLICCIVSGGLLTKICSQ